MELEELSRIQNVDAREILKRPIAPLKTPTGVGTEYDMALDALKGMKIIKISNRDILLPGLERHTPLILQVLAEFKEKKVRNVQPLMYAKADDIVIEPLRPEQFVLDNWVQAVVVGEEDILPQAPGVVTVNDDEIFIFTDFIEMKPTIFITAIQGEIDGSLYNPLEMRLAMKESDMQMYELDYPWIADITFDINGKCEDAGDSELTPFGVHICLGKQIAGIT